MNLDFLLLHLNLINGIGPGAIKYLLEKKPENFDLLNLYNLNILELKNIFKLTDNIANKIYNGLKDKNLLESELNLIDKNKIKLITINNQNYPDLLKNIYLPPIILYLQGQELDNNQNKIAVIGSRKANNYALKVIDQLIEPLIENSWAIVSGGAIGADTMAHQAALKFNGKTIVVLGSGLLEPYPNINKKLFEKIIESNGTIISTFSLKTHPAATNFPARNRIISGISNGCVVIQAALKSGTRITALNALEQGREVFAVPGQIDDELSTGCHKLIQEGAKLIYNANDILEEFGQNINKNTKNLTIFTDNLKVKPPESIEEKIIEICSNPRSIEEISEKIKIPVLELQFKLFDLQLEEKIAQNFTGLWESR